MIFFVRGRKIQLRRGGPHNKYFAVDYDIRMKTLDRGFPEVYFCRDGKLRKECVGSLTFGQDSAYYQSIEEFKLIFGLAKFELKGAL
jgi:hypothetical protein